MNNTIIEVTVSKAVRDIEVTVSKAVRDIEVNFTTGSGPAGLSAYQTAVLNGYVGTEGEWLASLKGDKGDTGAQGDKGDKGDQGPQGIQGDKGDTGAQGPKGDTGAQGEQGIQGEKGVQGDKGDTGAQGDKGDKGDKGDDAVTDAELSNTSANAVRNSTVTAKINAMDEVAALKAEISPSNGDASALREMYVAAGAEYDANTKTYTFGGIEGLSETQMRQAFVSSLELVKNKVTTVSANCTDDQYASAKAAYEAKKLLFIDEVSCWGMQYNSETGFFEYHGMTDITYEQALYAYTITSQAGQGRNLDNCFYGIKTLRFNFAPLGNDCNVWVNSNFGEFAYCVNLEQYNTNNRGYHLVMGEMFKGCKKLRKIETISFVAGNSRTTNAFKGCTALEEFDFRLTKNDMNFADSPQIKLPCIVNLINNLSTTLTSAITITLENSVYSKAIADNDIINALALQPMAQLASA